MATQTFSNLNQIIEELQNIYKLKEFINNHVNNTNLV